MTTDERLAALEAKLDALTAPPSDYYTSRYSGEEIDAAIAAVPGKAETAQLCNRNLMDNWYFGNPVDQRGGHIVLAGTQFFVAGASTPSGVLSMPTKVIGYLTTGDITYPQIVVDGTTYITPTGSDVRGYVGAGYTVDRWFAKSPGTVVTVQSDHVSIAPPASNYFGWMNYFEADSLLGQTVTFSALCRYTGSGGTILPYITAYIGDNQYGDSAQINQTAWQCVSFTLTFSTDKPSDGRFGFDVVSMQNFGVDVKAAKLELGSRQTLAHQDADGNWVLNEVPNYGKQLARYQRYALECTLSGYIADAQIVGIGSAETTSIAHIVIPTPTTMRTLPTITWHDLILRQGGQYFTPTTISVWRVSAIGVTILVTCSGLTVGAPCELRTNTNNGRAFLAADL